VTGRYSNQLNYRSDSRSNSRNFKALPSSNGPPPLGQGGAW
jgi:hypothetical protein